MAYTSNEVKDRYKKKAYDQVIFYVPKGEKEHLKKMAIDQGCDSLSDFIKQKIYGKEDTE